MTREYLAALSVCASVKRALLAVVLISLSAAAQTIYTWTDDDGVVHYTDDASLLPEKKVARAKPEAAALSVVPKQAEPLVPYLNLERWRDDVPACKDALAHFRARRAALEAAEAKLNELKRQFAPCQRFADVCYAKGLTLETWKRECRERPKACDVDPELRQQEYAVEVLRDEVDQLPAWLRKVAGACTK